MNPDDISWRLGTPWGIRHVHRMWVIFTIRCHYLQHSRMLWLLFSERPHRRNAVGLVRMLSVFTEFRNFAKVRSYDPQQRTSSLRGMFKVHSEWESYKWSVLRMNSSFASDGHAVDPDIWCVKTPRATKSSIYWRNSEMISIMNPDDISWRVGTPCIGLQG